MALGVERQRVDAVALIERRGWMLIGVYTDNDVAASGRKRRPEWERLLADVESGVVDTVVAYSSSRLYRNLRDLTRLIDLADTGRVLIATVVSGDIDLAHADGRMLARILASVDQAEWEKTSERLKRAFAGGRRTPGSGRRAFGYHADWSVDPQSPHLSRPRAA